MFQKIKSFSYQKHLHVMKYVGWEKVNRHRMREIRSKHDQFIQPFI
jgi:hypothetical protein